MWPAKPRAGFLRDPALGSKSARVGQLSARSLIGAGRAHILGPAGQVPRWSTVSVSAPEAAGADALSTAFCLMDRPAIDAALTAFPGARVEILA